MVVHSSPESMAPAGRRSGAMADAALIFLHIMKAGGTSFGAALAQRFAEHEIMDTELLPVSGASDPLLVATARRYRLIGVGRHLDHDEVRAIVAALPEGRKAFTVTALRDPRARLISQFRHWQRSQDESLAAHNATTREAYLMARHMTLGAFLANRNPEIRANFWNIQAVVLAGTATARLATPEEIEAQARANLAGFDLVATTDAMEHALATIADAFGWASAGSVPALNVAPDRDEAPLDPTTEALITAYTQIDNSLWQALRNGKLTADAVPANFFQPAPAILRGATEGARTVFSMAQALDGHGWHVREGLPPYARWTGPEARSLIRLAAPGSRRVSLSFRLVSVLDWDAMPALSLTLDGLPSEAPPRVVPHGKGLAVEADFTLPEAGRPSHDLVIGLPHTRSAAEVVPGTHDHRRKGIAIGEITLAAPAAAGPARLGDLFWDGEPWAAEPLSTLADLLPLTVRPPPRLAAHRHLGQDVGLVDALFRLTAPEHVWVMPSSPFAHLAAGAPEEVPAGPARLMIVGTLFNVPGRGVALARLAERFSDATLVLACAEDFRLRELLRNPIFAPHVHLLGCTNGIIVASLSGLRAASGPNALNMFLLLLGRIGATTPERLRGHGARLGARYATLQLGLVLEGLFALARNEAPAKALLGTTVPDRRPEPLPADPAAWAEAWGALVADRGHAVALLDQPLKNALTSQLGALVAAAPGSDAAWHAAMAAHECAFRITGILYGWHHFGLAGNSTAVLAREMAAAATPPPIQPKPLKPFDEYIDFYKAEARIMAAQPPSPGTRLTLGTLRGGLDHVTRLHQAAREVELALRLLGERHPNEEILWVDAGCSYGVLLNTVEPPPNVRGRCRFLGFDFNSPGIEVARAAAEAAGNAHCRFEVGDVTDAQAVIGGARIHLITAFEVLEHCADPVAVLRDYRGLGAAMVVLGSPLGEAQGIFPTEQHLWSFQSEGYAAMATAAGFQVLGINRREVGRFIGGHDWVTVTAVEDDVKEYAVV